MMTSEKRTAILKATLHMVSEHGFHDAPMAKIADAADVGAGTIYRYFENKDDLINELFLELKKEISQAMLAGFDPDAPLEEQYRTFWYNTINFCLDNPDEMSFIEQYHNSPYLTPETEELTMHYLAPLLKAIQKGVEDGLLKPLPFEMLSAFTSDAAFKLARHHINGAIELDEQNMQLSLQASWDAISL